MGWFYEQYQKLRQKLQAKKDKTKALKSQAKEKGKAVATARHQISHETQREHEANARGDRAEAGRARESKEDLHHQKGGLEKRERNLNASADIEQQKTAAHEAKMKAVEYRLDAATKHRLEAIGAELKERGIVDDRQGSPTATPAGAGTRSGSTPFRGRVKAELATTIRMPEAGTEPLTKNEKTALAASQKAEQLNSVNTARKGDGDQKSSPSISTNPSRSKGMER